jgi:hypothetical protein
VLKASEKKRSSVTEGVVTQLPALSLYATLLAKSELVGRSPRTLGQAFDAALAALNELRTSASNANDAPRSGTSSAWSRVLVALLEAARVAGVDLEGVLRSSALELLDETRSIEQSTKRSLPED